MLNKKLLVGISTLALAAGSASAQTANNSTVTQTGAANEATVCNDPNQPLGTGCTAVPATATGNNSSIQQNGFANSAFVQQSGSNNTSVIIQNGDGNLARHLQYGNRNVARSDQAGDEMTSIVEQGSTAVASSDNSAVVTQRGPSSGIAFGSNAGHTSTVTQSGNFNSATVGQFGGEELRNVSTISQTADADLATAGVQAVTTSTNRNAADVAQAGSGNTSSVTQNGMRNFARVSMSGGGDDTVTVDTNGDGTNETRAEGNSIQITQNGNGLQARVASGVPNAANGKGNVSQVTQTGDRHDAIVWQRGVLDTATISQSNGTSVTAEAFARADVSQNSLFGVVGVTQTGDNNARVSQGLGQSGNVSVTQIDAGDDPATVNDPSNPFESGSTTGGARRFNDARIGQSGNLNSATVRQNAIGAYTVVFQQANLATAGQGGASTTNTARSNNNGAMVDQGQGAVDVTLAAGELGTGSPAVGVGQGGGSSTRLVTATITQAGQFNSSTIRQNGTNHTASIEQYGSGSGAANTNAQASNGTTLRNTVLIEQLGNMNQAYARQDVGVGASTSTAPAAGNTAAQNEANCLALGGDAVTCAAATEDPFRQGAGVQNAEITILQSGSNLYASVTQQGRGQFARIRQSGSFNSGTITQTSTATNAVAVLEQSGRNNQYTITQTVPGEFDYIVQSGTGNTVNTAPGAGSIQRPSN